MTPSGVMRFQAGIKVFGKPGVESVLIDFGLQDIDVVKLHGLPGRSFEMPNNNHCPPSPEGSGAAYFASTSNPK